MRNNISPIFLRDPILLRTMEIIITKDEIYTDVRKNIRFYLIYQLIDLSSFGKLRKNRIESV